MESVAKTLFIPFYFRYLESISKKEIYDNEAVEFFKNLDNLNWIDFSNLDKDLYLKIISRTKLIDYYLMDLLKKPIDNIFNIGCGLDFKNRRLNIQKPWYNIDLPSVIQFRNKNFLELDLEKSIEGDILKSSNWDFIPNEVNVFILEGILMFFSEEIVLSFIKNMCNFSKKAYFIIQSIPLNKINNRHSIISRIDNRIILRWGIDDIEKFAVKANLTLVSSHRYTDVLTERWMSNEQIENNYRVSLFECKSD